MFSTIIELYIMVNTVFIIILYIRTIITTGMVCPRCSGR